MPSSSHSDKGTGPDGIDLVSSSLRLRNGTNVPNRLVKVAMEEGIGWGGGIPGKPHQRLYRRWGSGGWGMIITGNVQTDPQHLATPHDRTVPDASPETIAAYSGLRDALLSDVPASSSPPLTLVQISHAGLQSSSTENGSRAPWIRAVGPCSARPDTGKSVMGWIWGRALWPLKSRTIVDLGEWLMIVDGFVRAARVVQQAGWDGLQIHSAHGYLLAEYLSPLTNPHPFPLPDVPLQIPLRLHLLWLVLARINKASDPKFIKAVKINCSDFVQGGLNEIQCTDMIKEIVSWNFVDILEISGGNYSSPAFATLDDITNPSSKRQSLFAHFTTSLIPHLPPPPEGPAILLTGGLHSRDLIVSSLRNKACDLVGIGRPACVKPELPRKIVLNREIPTEEARFGGYKLPGGETMKRVLGGGVTPSMSHNNDPPIASYIDGEAVPETESSPLLPKQEAREKQKGVPLVGAGISTYWHEWQMCRIGRGEEPDMGMHWLWGGVCLEMVWWGWFGGGLWGWWTTRSKLDK